MQILAMSTITLPFKSSFDHRPNYFVSTSGCNFISGVCRGIRLLWVLSPDDWDCICRPIVDRELIISILAGNILTSGFPRVSIYYGGCWNHILDNESSRIVELSGRPFESIQTFLTWRYQIYTIGCNFLSAGLRRMSRLQVLSPDGWSFQLDLPRVSI